LALNVVLYEIETVFLAFIACVLYTNVTMMRSRKSTAAMTSSSSYAVSYLRKLLGSFSQDLGAAKKPAKLDKELRYLPEKTGRCNASAICLLSAWSE
jgi:hypothetical protein